MRATYSKKLGILLLALFAVLTLAACGPDAGDSGDTADAGDAEVLISFTGAREGEVAINNLSLYCGNEGMRNSVDTFEIYMFDMPVVLNMRMPADLEPGTYSVVGSDDRADLAGATASASFEWRDMGNNDRVNYDSGAGELAIEQIPGAQGEQFVATLTMDFTSEDGETVSTTIEFDGDAGSQSFDDC